MSSLRAQLYVFAPLICPKLGYLTQHFPKYHVVLVNNKVFDFSKRALGARRAGNKWLSLRKSC